MSKNTRKGSDDAESARRQRTQDEVAFFDEFVEKNGDYDVLSEVAYRRLEGVFARWIKPRAGERCIDLGCGTGAFTRRLNRFGVKAEGMDISPAAVAFASKASAAEHYHVGDITASGLPDASYDVVLYSGVLHHFPTQVDRAAVLREGYRLLAPGGRLFAYDPNQHSPSMWLYRDPRSPLYSEAGKTDNEVLLSRAELTGELSSAGFRKVRVRGVSGIAYRYIESANARRLLPLYNLYEQVVRWSPLESRLGTFVVSVAHKLGT
ncbi:MAG TPA: class I SAM-dependent methyltransferase [Polyangiales bacterium]|nr:class I SAM-dependent methyltransferase [Polyangiales bacterium]